MYLLTRQELAFKTEGNCWCVGASYQSEHSSFIWLCNSRIHVRFMNPQIYN
ncbi:hypothetical protein Mp_8g16150 [Marchantia polymorpha subsp. ruderalis]|uniref:Uncharacterized protein n=1 Tax=Marchantia polymorpha TaxID=3197 RepID=A0A2R6VXV2_MARPO|nr:hypothetical protein MARPO_1662s0001 [Marchantia polymorpha]BBN20064.1 hypothetical protein Mp_8g16150 [Marchantia polymorpha subsp. ruderalis]|eukprot:PTQ26441.1 hypothetical protein MARPO_1662s0001 [Marchantia polymorpha]